MRNAITLCGALCGIGLVATALAGGAPPTPIHDHGRVAIRPGSGPSDRPLPLRAGSSLEVKTKVVRWGPFQIPAATSLGPGIAAFAGLQLEMPCTDCFITSMAVDLLQEDGRPLNYGTDPPGRGSWIVVNAAREAVPCRTAGEPVFAAPNERMGLVLPAGYGYYNPRYSYWFAGRAALQNFSKQVVTAFLDFKVTYAPGSADLKPTTFIGLDHVACRTSPPFYAIGPGYSDAHKEWVADRGGDIVAIVGHMHDFGISVGLENVTTGQRICTAIAGYGAGSAWAPVGPGSGEDDLHPASPYELSPGNPDYAGHIEHMDTCVPRLSVKKGDVLRMHTQYYAPVAQNDVMGTMGIFMHVTDPPPCTLAMRLFDYRDGTLSLLFNVGKAKGEGWNPATWNLWLVTESGMTLVRSSLFPNVDPPLPLPWSLSGLAGLGRVGVLSTLSTLDGTICSDWATVDTGPRSITAGSARVEERELTLDAATFSGRMEQYLRSAGLEGAGEVATPGGACHLGAQTAQPVRSVGAGAPGLSAPVWNPANGHYYEAVAVPEGIDWPRAIPEAAKRSFNGWQGHLATITSKEENDFLTSSFPQIVGENGYWLGGSRQASGRDIGRGWTWLTGEAVAYANWQAGAREGKDTPQAIHYSTDSGKWGGRSIVSAVGGYVVEYEAECSLAVRLEREGGTLRVNATAVTGEPAKWNLWMVVGRQAIPVVARGDLPEDGSSGEVSASMWLPRAGVVGLLTTVTTSRGTVCSDWRTVEAEPRRADAIPPTGTVSGALSERGR